MLIPLFVLIFIRPFISSLAFPYLNAVYYGLFFTWILLWIIFRGLSFKEGTPILPTSLFLLAMATGLILYGNQSGDFRELYNYISGVLLFIVCIPLDYKEKNRLSGCVIAGGLCISFLAIYQYFFGFNHLLNYIAKEKITDPFIIDYVSRGRVFYPFITPNALGGYLAMLIPLALTYKSRFWLTPSLILALLLTKSIGSLFSLFLALILYFYLEGKFKKRHIFILSGLLIVTGLVFISRAHLKGEHLQPLFSTAMRLSYWQDTWGIIKAHLFTGVGVGNFNLTYSRYSHNAYLQIWAETGIFGIIAWLWLIICALKTGLKTLHRPAEKTRAIGWICSSCVFLVHNFMDFSFYLPEISLIWWLILGFIISYRGKEYPEDLRTKNQNITPSA